MRRWAAVRCAAVFGLAFVSCDGTAASPASPPSSADLPSTTLVQPATPRAPTSATVATTLAAPLVHLHLDPAERPAVRGGIVVEVLDEAGARLGILDGEHPDLAITTHSSELRFRYVTAEGEPTDVVWRQNVEASTRVRQPWRQRADPASGDIVLLWQSNGSPADYRAQLDGALPHVTVVSPIWFFVSADGTVVGDPERDYVDFAHERGVLVWPAVAGLDADANHALLSDPDARTAAAERLSERSRAVGADGVNIDIEGFRDEDGPHFTEFVAELTELVHEWGGVVSYDLIPRSDTWEVSPPELAFWSTAPQRRELADLVDYTVLMAYDQHNRFRPAGPVASPPWVEEVLAYVLRYADPHEVVLGVPFYGRIWDPGELDRPKAVGVASLASTAASGVAELDPAFDLSRVDLPDGRFLWLEDQTVIAERLGLVEEHGLAGWAAWRLGFDSPRLWEEIAAR